MNISRLGQGSGSDFTSPRVAKTNVRPTAKPAVQPTGEGGTAVDGNSEPMGGGSARLASFADSLESRIDQMATSGKLSDRQLAVLQDVKKQFGSMMARLDRAFSDGKSLDPNASDVMSHILDLTSQSLDSVLGKGSEPTPVTNQRQFAYGPAASSTGASGKSIDTVV